MSDSRELRVFESLTGVAAHEARLAGWWRVAEGDSDPAHAWSEIASWCFGAWLVVSHYDHDVAMMYKDALNLARNRASLE